MIIDVLGCCEEIVGIHRINCSVGSHLDGGEVPYGRACGESEEIAKPNLTL